MLYAEEGNSFSDERPPLRERIFFSGNFSLQFGTYTNIEISPAVGVRLLPRLSVACGATYRFYSSPIERTNIYGGRTYLQFMAVNNFNEIIPIGFNGGLYLHAEYELLSLQNRFWQNGDASGRSLVHSPLLGFGLNQPIGPRSSMQFTILWPLHESGYQLYGNPEVRVGFSF